MTVVVGLFEASPKEIGDVAQASLQQKQKRDLIETRI
jgi:hypothetical protein